MTNEGPDKPEYGPDNPAMKGVDTGKEFHPIRDDMEHGPDNPAMGGVNTGKEFHPTREDLEREHERVRRWELMNTVAPESFKSRVRRHLSNLADWNNAIRFPAWEWLAIFVVWWMAMMFIVLATISGLGAMYEIQHMTFNVGGVAFLLNVVGFMLFPCFPVYVLLYGIMSLSEHGRRR